MNLKGINMRLLKSTSLTSVADGALTSNQMVYIFLGFLVIIMAVMFIKKNYLSL